jgi:predicted pyridoxine 5'-phosphate oxidase superfamily flavin-nucleotide-binding protein
MARSRHLLVVDPIVRGIEDGNGNRPIIFVRLRNRGRSRLLGRVHADPEGRGDSAWRHSRPAATRKESEQNPLSEARDGFLALKNLQSNAEIIHRPKVS